MTRRHATDDVDPPEKTLCGRPLLSGTLVDNATPDCRKCLRVIAARIKNEQ